MLKHLRDKWDEDDGNTDARDISVEKDILGNCSGESRYLIKAIYIHEITVETILKLGILR